MHLPIVDLLTSTVEWSTSDHDFDVSSFAHDRGIGERKVCCMCGDVVCDVGWCILA
jgi:hypothetical protein